jgi:4-amino-4-deoxy-L-arabinose transferase-like glycosyltransferase
VPPISKRTRRGVLGVVVTFLALGLMQVFIVPPLLPSDESSHVSYALTLANGDLPRLDQSNVPGFPHMNTAATIFTANHPPLLYALVAVPLEAGIHADQPITGLKVARIISLLFGLAAVLGAALLARLVLPAREDVPVIAAAVVALTPTVPHVSGIVYNDAIGMAGSTWLLVAGMLVLRRGVTRRTVLLLMAAAAFAALARSSSLFALLPAILLAGYGARRWRPALGIGALTMGATVVAGGWWYLRNKHLYGSFLGNGYLTRRGRVIPKRPFGDVLVDLRVWRFMLGRMWNGFTLPNRLVPTWSGWWGALVEVPAVVGLVIGFARAVDRRLRPSRDTLVIWGALGLFCATAFVSVVGFVSIGGNQFPRYFFPMLPVAGIVIGIGYGYLPRLLAPLALALTGVANVLLLHRYMIAAGVFERGPRGTAQLDALRSNVVAGSFLLLALVLLGVGIALAAGALWRRPEAYPAGTAESRATSAA